MSDLFTPIIQQLDRLGFFNFFFPWLIAVAVMYAILKKSKILGESVIINGIVSLAVAFLILGFPVLSGISWGSAWSTFFAQSMIFILIFAIGFIMASLFYPDLPKMLIEQFTRRTTLWVMLGLGIALFITSGLVGTLWFGTTKPPEPGAPTVPSDVITILTGVILLVVILLIASSVARMAG